MGHITHLDLALGQLSVLTIKERNSLSMILTTQSLFAARDKATKIVALNTGLTITNSRSIARRMLRILKVEIRENIKE